MPLYLYLDQRDLIDCVGNRAIPVRRRLETLVQSGRVQVILSFAHVLENWKYRGSVGRSSLADYADSLKPWWILNRDYLFQEEARAAGYVRLGLPIRVSWTPSDEGQRMSGVGEANGCFCPFRRSLHEVFPQARYDTAHPSTGASLNFAGMVNAMDKIPEIPSGLLKLDEAYASSQPDSRSKRVPLASHKQFVSYVFYEAFADVSDQAAQLFSRLGATLDDLRCCPAVDTYLRVRRAIHADAKARPDASEMEDVVHLVALPYVDAFSTDKRIADYIRRAKLFPSPYAPERVRGMSVFRHLTSALDWLEAHG
jgi:hypothetical protein